MSPCFTHLNHISYILENNYFVAFFFSKLCGVDCASDGVVFNHIL